MLLKAIVERRERATVRKHDGSRARFRFVGRARGRFDTGWSHAWKEFDVSCVSANDRQLARLADAIAQRVGQQRFHVWFNNSTRLDLRQDGLEIAVPNDFISEWIGKNFTRPIQEAAHEVLGTPLPVRFSVVPELFEVREPQRPPADNGSGKAGGSRKEGVRKTEVMGRGHVRDEVAVTRGAAIVARPTAPPATGSTVNSRVAVNTSTRPRLRHDLETFVVGPSNQLAYNAATYVAEFPGVAVQPAVHPRQVRPGQDAPAPGPVQASSSSITRPSAGCT